MFLFVELAPEVITSPSMPNRAEWFRWSTTCFNQQGLQPNANELSDCLGGGCSAVPAASRYFTSSRCPSCAASISGVEQPSSMSAPALIRKSATSRKPPQQASVRAVSCVSSVWALMLAPATSQHRRDQSHSHLFTVWTGLYSLVKVEYFHKSNQYNKDIKF